VNSRTVIVLALAAVVLGLAAWMAGSRSGSDAPTGVGEPLVPGLVGHVNDVAAISIATRDAHFTVRKDGEIWKVTDRDGYPARYETVKKTLMGLAAMQTVDAKSSNPALYTKMGVEDPEQPDSSSALVTLLDASGKSLGAAIIGHNGSSASTIYARRASEPQSWLVKSDLYLERSIKQWLDADMWKLPSGRVKSVTAVHADGEQVAVSRASETETGWTLAGVPEGQQPKSSSIGRVLGAALENLSFENVAAAASKPLPDDDHVITTFQTFDGLQVVVTSGKEQPPAPAAGADGKTPAAPPAVWWAKFEVSAGPDANDTVKAEATKAMAQLAPWIYALPEYQATSLRKRMADMIQPVAATPAAPGAAAPGAAPPGTESGESDESGDEGDGDAAQVPVIAPPPEPAPEPADAAPPADKPKADAPKALAQR
jgi:hypothetical protein